MPKRLYVVRYEIFVPVLADGQKEAEKFAAPYTNAIGLLPSNGPRIQRVDKPEDLPDVASSAKPVNAGGKTCAAILREQAEERDREQMRLFS